MFEFGAEKSDDVIAHATPGEQEMDDIPESSQSKYCDLVYIYSADAAYMHELSAALGAFDHEVIGFFDLEEFRAAILVRAPAAAVLDIDSEGGKLAKSAMATRVITSFPVIYISAIDNFQSIYI